MTPRARLVLRHFMNKLCRGPQGDATYQISNLYAFKFQRKKNFEEGLLRSYVPTCDSWAGASFDPKGII